MGLYALRPTHSPDYLAGILPIAQYVHTPLVSASAAELNSSGIWILRESYAAMSACSTSSRRSCSHRRHPTRNVPPSSKQAADRGSHILSTRQQAASGHSGLLDPRGSDLHLRNQAQWHPREMTVGSQRSCSIPSTTGENGTTIRVHSPCKMPWRS